MVRLTDIVRGHRLTVEWGALEDVERQMTDDRFVHATLGVVHFNNTAAKSFRGEQPVHSRSTDNRAAMHRRRPVSCQPCPCELAAQPTAATVAEPPPGAGSRNQNGF